MYDLYPGQRATGEVLFDGENLLDAASGHQSAARPHRHGVPEADAVPDVDLREHRLRHPALREAAARRVDARVETGAAPRRAVGRGQGQAQRQRLSLSAASSSGSASPAPWR
jgi:hypothetical protein